MDVSGLYMETISYGYADHVGYWFYWRHDQEIRKISDCEAIVRRVDYTFDTHRSFFRLDFQSCFDNFDVLHFATLC